MTKQIDWRGEEVSDPILLYVPCVEHPPHYHIEMGQPGAVSHRLKLTPPQARQLWQQLDAYFAGQALARQQVK